MKNATTGLEPAILVPKNFILILSFAIHQKKKVEFVLLILFSTSELYWSRCGEKSIRPFCLCD